MNDYKKCKICKNTKAIKELQKQVKDLQKQIDLISDISGDNVNLGSFENPIDNIFVSNIVSNDFSLKGITLDDTTEELDPSFESFPRNWLRNDTPIAPIASFRTYHYDGKTPDWIRWGIQNNLEVMIGITLEFYQTELNQLSVDYLTDPELRRLYDINIIAIGVGNEESDIAQMNEGMIYAKSLISSGRLPRNAKVTTVLLNESAQWITPTYPPMSARFTQNFLELYPNMDIICFNLYDGYSLTDPNVPIEVKLSWGNPLPSVTLNGFGAVRFAIDAAIRTEPNFVDKPFWCTEIGWESSGGNENSSLDNLRTFYNNFLLFNMMSTFIPQESTRAVRPPDRIFYFTIRDANNETFGLYTANPTLTPKF